MSGISGMVLPICLTYITTVCVNGILPCVDFMDQGYFYQISKGGHLRFWTF